MIKIVSKISDELKEYAIELKDFFHQNPELSGHEYQTADRICSELEALGIQHTRVGSCGVIGVLEGAAQGKTLMLRADIDALPMQESPHNLKGKKKLVSNIADAAHTCGHDYHIAMLLASAKILAAKAQEFDGTIVFCFESGEEDGSGVDAMIRALDERELHIDGCWAMHLYAPLECGLISVKSGPRMAGSSKFDVTLAGRGGHGSRPDQTIDPICCAAQILCSLHTISSRVVDPTETVVLSVGRLSAGTVRNIIPDEAFFAGTIRFFNPKEERKVRERFYSLVTNIAIANGCEADIYYQGPFPAVINDPQLSTLAHNAIKAALGEEYLADVAPWMASDTMGRYCQRFPCVYAFLGIRNDALGSGAAHHNSMFDVDEACIEVGIPATVAFALDFLRNPNK